MAPKQYPWRCGITLRHRLVPRDINPVKPEGEFSHQQTPGEVLAPAQLPHTPSFTPLRFPAAWGCVKRPPSPVCQQRTYHAVLHEGLDGEAVGHLLPDFLRAPQRLLLLRAPLADGHRGACGRFLHHHPESRRTDCKGGQTDRQTPAPTAASQKSRPARLCPPFPAGGTPLLPPPARIPPSAPVAPSPAPPHPAAGGARERLETVGDRWGPLGGWHPPGQATRARR